MSASIEKRERKMGLVARRICELLEERPDITARQVSEALGITDSSASWQMGSLTERGYVRIGGKHFSTYRLTGKEFPSSSDFKLSGIALKRRQKKSAAPESTATTTTTNESPLDEVDHAVRAMVRYARANEGTAPCA